MRNTSQTAKMCITMTSLSDFSKKNLQSRNNYSVSLKFFEIPRIQNEFLCII